MELESDWDEDLDGYTAQLSALLIRYLSVLGLASDRNHSHCFPSSSSPPGAGGVVISNWLFPSGILSSAHYGVYQSPGPPAGTRYGSLTSSPTRTHTGEDRHRSPRTMLENREVSRYRHSL